MRAVARARMVAGLRLRIRLQRLARKRLSFLQKQT